MLNSNFKDMLSAFNEAGVEYLLVGAYAMAAHGCPRATGDIDIWVRADEANAERVWQALRRFGTPLTKMNIEDFAQPDVVYQIGEPPQRIDVVTSISGVRFQDAWPEQVPVDVDDLTIPVIGLRQLIANKRATGREQDRVDAQVLSTLERS